MSNDQINLFIHDLSEALMDVIRANGGAKVVGHMLRPDMEPDEAGRWLANCLNDKKRDKLCLTQFMYLMKLGRQSGCHTVMTYIASDAGYTIPSPTEPEDEAAALQREFIAAVKAQEEITKRLERLQPLIRRAA